MDDVHEIAKHIKSFVVPRNNKIWSEETLAYIYSTKFVDRNQHIILPKLRNLVKKLIDLMKFFYREFKKETDEIAIDECISRILTCEDCQNTGAVKSGNENIQGIIHNGNIREIFCLFDEFFKSGCHIASWALYCNSLNDIENRFKLSRADVIDKLKYVAGLITGSNQNFFNDETELERFIRSSFGTKIKSKDGEKYVWEKSDVLSYCNVWNIHEKIYPSHKLLFRLDNLRYANVPKQYNFYDVVLGHAEGQKPPLLCDTDFRVDKKIMTFDKKKIVYPKISNRELEHLKKYNADIDVNDVVPWKGGCCFTYANTSTITGRLSEQFNKPRITSYSGHAVSDCELIKMLDGDFDGWKVVYSLCIMATMIPYCHHTAHEILSVMTFYGINYDIRLGYYENFHNIISSIHIPGIDTKTELTFLDEAKQRSKSIHWEQY